MLRRGLSTTSRLSPNPFVIFYDGQCPLCKREMALYQWIQEKSSKKSIDFVNIATAELPGSLTSRGVSRDDALRRIHGFDQGKLVTKASAFQSLWKYSTPFRYTIYPITLIPGFIPVADMVYEAFAERRWQHRSKLPAEKACALPSHEKGKSASSS